MASAMRTVGPGVCRVRKASVAHQDYRRKGRCCQDGIFFRPLMPLRVQKIFSIPAHAVNIVDTARR